MPQQLPYCGSAPVPGELLTRFNLDPILLAALVMLAVWRVTAVKTPGTTNDYTTTTQGQH
jgi:putative membrane protein